MLKLRGRRHLSTTYDRALTPLKPSLISRQFLSEFLAGKKIAALRNFATSFFDFKTAGGRL
jgi:hypothetical protein